MSIETFNEGIKLLKRFLKEEGLYYPIFVKYLFRNGKRPLKDLFDEFNSTMFNDVDDWNVVFNRKNLLGYKKISEFSQDVHSKLIGRPAVDVKWRKYYNSNKKSEIEEI